MTQTILHTIQIVISLGLIGGILLQQRGGGLSPVLGGASGVYRTRRGIEKSVFVTTIALAVLFILAALVSIIL